MKLLAMVKLVLESRLRQWCCSNCCYRHNREMGILTRRPEGLEMACAKRVQEFEHLFCKGYSTLAESRSRWSIHLAAWSEHSSEQLNLCRDIRQVQ